MPHLRGAAPAGWWGRTEDRALLQGSLKHGLSIGMKEFTRQQILQESGPYFATARLWDDGIIDPRDTRAVLGIALSAAHSAPVRGATSWGVYRH